MRNQFGVFCFSTFVKNIFLKAIYSIFSFLFISLILSAQNSDSAKIIIKAPVAEYFQEKDFFPNNSAYKSIDTSLDGIQKYFPNDFPYGLGLSNRKLFFETFSEIGFRNGFESLDLFGYNRDEIKYYRTRTPYTEIFVLFGMKKEQFARLLHTQNITKQWNIALNMLRLRSEGFYNKQNCTDNNISLSSNYTSKNNRYSLLANGIINSIKADENGGVRDDMLELNLFVNKKLIPVNLLDARTRRGKREFSVTQFLNFGKTDTSSRTDSTSRKIIPRNFFSYTCLVKDNWFVYEDKNPSSGFYENIFFDSTLTHDSTYIFSFNNTVSWKSYLMKNIYSEVLFEQKNSRLVEYNTDSSLALDTSFYDQIVKLKIGNMTKKDKSNGFFWTIGKQYVLSGAHQGDDYVYGTISLLFNKNKKISLDYKDSYHSVPFIYNYYTSNHFWWRNSFDNITERTSKISYYDLKNKLVVSAMNTYIDNYVYFDSTFFPVLDKQHDNIGFYTLSIEKNFQLKHFGFNNLINWTSLEDVPKAVIHLPKFVSHNSIYYKGSWFKGATNVQIGFDVTYFSAYYADAYMPALGQYYLQNEKKIGNYPFIDFFFNMKVKHARIFFKTEHVNSGLMGAYYLAPNNPAPDRSFKVGINWMFYD
ncbi:MAG: hypothetical protein HY841_06275 [Bacteroidetes bacterium]|nr:hypothetical protein [Bacteroidota bacterium]